MKFFIPEAKDADQAEGVYAATRQFVEEQTGDKLTSRRVAAIAFVHNGKPFRAVVGERFERIGEPVIAILEGRIYYVCTPNRAVLRGEPYLVGREEVQTVEDFD